MRAVFPISVFVLATSMLLFSCSDAREDTPDQKKRALQNLENTADNNMQQPLNSAEMNSDKEPVKAMTNTDLSELERLQLLKEFQTGQRPFDFYAVFTEPFWTLYFFGNQVLFVGIDTEVPQVVPLEYPFNDRALEQTLRFMLNDELWELKITLEQATDGMSDITYPYQVQLDNLEGAGATTKMKQQ